MRRLALLALTALAAFPLSAHGPWHRPRRVVVVERDACGDVYRDAWRDTYHDNWRDSYRRRDDDDRWERRGYGAYPRYVQTYREDGCGEDRVVVRPLPRPLTPPFQARVELWLR